MSTKKCLKCNELKSFKEFYKDNSKEDLLTIWCKSCHKILRDSNREKNRLYMENLRKIDKDRINSQKRDFYKKLDPRKKMFYQAKNRSGRKGIEFNIKIEDIIIPDKCPLLEIDFVNGIKNDYEFTYSLDRKDPKKGYIKDNIWVITKLANSMKNSASKEDLIIFAKNILKYFKDSDIV